MGNPVLETWSAVGRSAVRSRCAAARSPARHADQHGYEIATGLPMIGTGANVARRRFSVLQHTIAGRGRHEI